MIPVKQDLTPRKVASQVKNELEKENAKFKTTINGELSEIKQRDETFQS
jgi:hypothetical protein